MLLVEGGKADTVVMSESDTAVAVFVDHGPSLSDDAVRSTVIDDVMALTTGVVQSDMFAISDVTAAGGDVSFA